ncbi:MAG: CHAT domain-containing protein [Acidobacteriota bacterium]
MRYYHHYLVTIVLSIVTLIFFASLWVYQGESADRKVGSIRELVYAVGSRRPTEARLTGGFAYGPFLPSNMVQIDTSVTKPTSGNDDHFPAVVMDRRNYKDKVMRGGSREKPFTDYLEIVPFVFNNTEARNRDGGSDGEMAGSSKAGGLLSSQLKAVSAKILFAFIEKPSTETTHSVALLYLVSGKAEKAIEVLEPAVVKEPINDKLLNDLAAAYLARAEIQSQPYDMIRALSVIDKAVDVNPGLLEARFNRALIFDKLGLFSFACEAWEEYLKIDQGSEWAKEAQNHIVKLNAKPLWEILPQMREELVRSVLAGEENRARAIVERFPHFSRLYAINELLPEWADRRFEGQLNDATNSLLIARMIGTILAEVQNDNLINEAIGNIDAVMQQDDPARIADLVSAYRLYRNGERLATLNEPYNAIVQLDKAIELFASLEDITGKTLAVVQRVRCDMARNHNRVLDSCAKIREIAQQQGYPYLLGRAWRLTGEALLYRSEISGSMAAQRAALPYFEALGDVDQKVMCHIFIARTFSRIGDMDEVWKDLFEGRKYFGKTATILSHYYLLFSIANELVTTSDFQEALYFYDESIKFATMMQSNANLFDSFYRRSLIYNKLGNKEAAIADLEVARKLNDEVMDLIQRARRQDYLLIAEGALKSTDDPQVAIEAYSKAIETYEQTTERYDIRYLYLSRAQAYISLHENSKAEADLQKCLKEIEHGRGSINDVFQRIKYLEGPQAVYDEMILFQAMKRNRADIAFNYVEEARARALLDAIAARNNIDLSAKKATGLYKMARPLSLPAIQRRLPDGATIIEYSLLADRLLIWIVKRGMATLVQSQTGELTIERLTKDFISAVERNEKKEELIRKSTPLFNTVLEPVLPFLSPRDTLVIVPDKILYLLPFAALIDPAKRRYLIEDYPLSFAPSANVFVKCAQRDNQLARESELSILTFGNPTFDRRHYPSLADLSSAKAEAKFIDNLYRSHNKRHKLLTGKDATKTAFLASGGDNTIIHFAGHAVMNANRPLYSKLIFSTDNNEPGSNDPGTLHAYELYRTSFHRTRLVVLAACQTAAGRSWRGEGVINLAHPFLCAGVPTVVASLWNTSDEAAPRFFAAFHEEKVAGNDAAASLRQAQLALLNDPGNRFSAPLYWASYVLLGGVAPINNK